MPRIIQTGPTVSTPPRDGPRRFWGRCGLGWFAETYERRDTSVTVNVRSALKKGLVHARTAAEHDDGDRDHPEVTCPPHILNGEEGPLGELVCPGVRSRKRCRDA